MEQRFFIGNWKSNMTLSEMQEWFLGYVPVPELTTIVCVPFTLLASAHTVIEERHLPLQLGAQDVSPFGSGPYTGEISATMIKEFADFVLVGHSERRQYFNESLEELAFQSLQAKTAGLSVIYCVSDPNESIPQSVDVVAYEPVEAIGTGIPEKPEVIASVCSKFREISGKSVIYGGSVSEKTLDSIIKTKAIDGLLVGGVSLDSTAFSDLGKQYYSYL